MNFLEAIEEMKKGKVVCNDYCPAFMYKMHKGNIVSTTDGYESTVQKWCVMSLDIDEQQAKWELCEEEKPNLKEIAIQQIMEGVINACEVADLPIPENLREEITKTLKIEDVDKHGNEFPFADKSWKVYNSNDNRDAKEPEKQGLWEKGLEGVEPASFIHIGARYACDITNNLGFVSPFYFKNPEQLNAWKDALTTFMRLKSLGYAVQPTENTQYIIDFEYLGCPSVELPWDSYMGKAPKISVISPMFETKEDVAKAIEEIGEENLIHMFKTFQGVYE